MRIFEIITVSRSRKILGSEEMGGWSSLSQFPRYLRSLGARCACGVGMSDDADAKFQLKLEACEKQYSSACLFNPHTDKVRTGLLGNLPNLYRIAQVHDSTRHKDSSINMKIGKFVQKGSVWSR